MTALDTNLELRLVADFLGAYPAEAVEELEKLSGSEAAPMFSALPEPTAAAAFERLAPAVALDLLPHLDAVQAAKLLFGAAPPQAGALLSGLDQEKREEILECLEPAQQSELRGLMEQAPETAGSLMDTRISVFRPESTVADAIDQLRLRPSKRRLFSLLVVDAERRLSGTVTLQEAALADPGATLGGLVTGPPFAVSAEAKREEVVELMERHRLATIPVVDFDGRPIGVIRLAELLSSVENVVSADMVSITGAGKDERALSSAAFAVRKRLPWLQINLATAFLAASVVGFFEETISQFTALAVLLPVVAGQSGNTGAQALAVVLRGLALREITLRHWPKVMVKEFTAGLINGVAVAVVTCIGVYIWSGSLGLVGVIGLAMISSMAIAGVAGAVIPVLLSALGQDPAQSSSIVLTTVTDVFGFLSFLGLATAFASVL